ncbi:MAG: hypothetical protein PUF56_03695, partial [Lachnospiraceae bacterium]|nr:hypothetical protein [Lachnospiraceae bacterium]
MSWKEYRLDDDFIPKRKKSKGKKGSDKKGSDKKSSDKKGSDKKGSDKKGSGKKGSDKRNPEKQDSNKRNSETKGSDKKGSDQKTLNKKASEKKISDRRNGKKSDKKFDQKSDQKLKNREAFPISDEKKSKILALLMDPNYRPMKTKEIAVLLGIPKAQRLMLQEILDSLVVSGSANVSKKGKYRFSDQLKAKEARISDSDDRTSDSEDVKLSVFPEGTDPKSLVGQTVTGTFTVHPKGFGFLTIEGFPEDLYV